MKATTPMPNFHGIKLRPIALQATVTTASQATVRHCGNEREFLGSTAAGTVAHGSFAS